jgi:hypothetical protein
MSEFKPMVKMYTDEPSVSLKLKKGGKVHHKKHHKEHEEHGHKNMQHHAMGGMHQAFASEMGSAPKKPSMMARMKAMNPQMYKKGGKVAHKLMGGAMAPGAAGMPGAMAPMGAAALGQMAPAARAARAMQVRKAMAGMKKGGSADHKMLEKLEKELHHHEKLDMKHAHPVRKASGGEIDRAETKTTLEKGAKKFAKTKVDDGQHHDKAHGTGEIHEGKPGGYKRGGKVHHMSGHPEGSHEHHKAMCDHYEKMCKAGGGSAHARKMLKHHEAMCGGGRYAEGGSTGNKIPSDTKKSLNKGSTKFGGTIEDNEHDYENTDMHTSEVDHASGTTGVRMSNAGGFRHGGKAHHKMHHKASGGAIDREETRGTIEGGNWENRPADTTPKGKSGTKTGEVKEANAGGYRHGGHASKKAYATGGNVVNDGKAVQMPRHFVSKPVANSLQSGTFKKGGKVHHHADGGQEKPNLRLIKAHTGPKGHVAKVYKDRDWNEHRVKFFSPEGKHYSDADYHTDDLSDAHGTAKDQLNRYKRGGKAHHFADGGPEDLSKGAYDKSIGPSKEDLDMAKSIRSIPSKLYEGAKDMLGFGSTTSKPAGSVTKTEKSVTVAPAKKRGGRA